MSQKVKPTGLVLHLPYSLYSILTAAHTVTAFITAQYSSAADVLRSARANK